MFHNAIRNTIALLSAWLLIPTHSALAALSLNDSPTAASIRSVLDGPGLSVSNVRVVKGTKGQYGVFSGGNDEQQSAQTLGIADGIYLTTGHAQTILPPNNNDKYTYNTRIEYADPDLTAISDNAIYDPAILEFDIIPEGDQLNFVLVFGSEEYPEYVCSKFNDVFGLFVSGPGLLSTQNAAFVPDTGYPIAVNNINGGQAGKAADGTQCNLFSSMYFVDNGNGSGNTGTQLDGFTQPLTATLGGLTAGERYRVKLAIADAGDQAYDSAAFFKWLTSTSSEPVDLELSATPSSPRPSANGFVDIRYVISNNSAKATRLVNVGVDLPPGVILVSDDSLGAFDSIEGIWNVGALNGGESRELNLRVGIGDAYSYIIEAEVVFAFNQDADSTPFNRGSQPAEDDTVTTKLFPTNNNPPIITYNNSAETARIGFTENNTTIIVDLDASDLDGDTEGAGLGWMIAGGSDADLFTLDARGRLSFSQPPNYETPSDADGNNDYEVIVKVCDSHSSCDLQTITVTINDIMEDPDGDGIASDIELAIGSDPQNPDSDGDGVDDGKEAGANPSQPSDSDQDGIPDLLDNDDDNDGVLTADETPNDNQPAANDTDQDGVPNYLDTDDDGDGLLTIYENYNQGTPADDDTDRDGKPDYLDPDDDADGLLTLHEAADPNGDQNPADAVDSEGDGIPDYLDIDNNHSPEDDNDGDGLSNAEEAALGSNPNEPDSDADGIPDQLERGNNALPQDSDQDGIPDLLDPDDDNDGILTVDENYNGGSPVDDNTDGDNRPDYLDPDDDNDGMPTRLEDYNGNSAADDDSDGDGIPDYLDSDDDNDGIGTWHENYNSALPDDDDTDGDGIADYLDADDDNDGLLTRYENPDPNQNTNPDDGLDSDGDGIKDYRDADDDGDQIPTKDEMADPNGDGNPDDAMDTDRDRIVEYLDPELTPFIKVSTRAILQGPYDATTGLMSDGLRRKGYLPINQPYSSLEMAFGYGSSGNIPGFQYTGNNQLSAQVLAQDGEAAAVDWVLIQARDANDPTKIRGATTAILQRNGNVVDPITGDPVLIISGIGPGEYYLAIRHRNHLGVMTATPIPLNDDSAVAYDFSSASLDVFGTNTRLFAGDIMQLWVGDLNNSNSIIAVGPGSDLTVMLGAVLVAPGNNTVNANYPLHGYFASDLNMDGKTIYGGPDNDANQLIGNVLLHPDNHSLHSNFVLPGSLPN